MALRAVLLNLLPAVLVAWLLTRRHFPGRTLLDAFVHLPLVMPPVVIGYLLLLLLGTRGPIGAWLDRTFDLQLTFSTLGAAVATAVMSFPLMVRAIRISLENVGPRAGGSRAHAGRRPVAPLRHHHAAADAARRAGRRGHRFRGGAGRVRRRDHLRIEHPR